MSNLDKEAPSPELASGTTLLACLGLGLQPRVFPRSKDGRPYSDVGRTQLNLWRVRGRGTQLMGNGMEHGGPRIRAVQPQALRHSLQLSISWRLAPCLRPAPCVPTTRLLPPQLEDSQLSSTSVALTACSKSPDMPILSSRSCGCTPSSFATASLQRGVSGGVGCAHTRLMKRKLARCLSGCPPPPSTLVTWLHHQGQAAGWAPHNYYHCMRPCARQPSMRSGAGQPA